MEDLLQRNIKDVRDAERNFERGRILITFNGVDGLTSNEDTVSKFLLRHGTGTAEFTDGIADSRTHRLSAPFFLSFDKASRRIMLGHSTRPKEIVNANKGGIFATKTNCDLLPPVSEVAPCECHADIR
jgi:hypothetical protein